MPTPASHPQMQKFLATEKSMTLATMSADGTPHACDIFYASSDDLRFYFLSDPKTLHIQNLERLPRVMVTIHGHPQGWQDIRGVQVAGTAARVNSMVEKAQGLRFYLNKFVFVRQWLPSADFLGQAHAQLGVVELYKITPRWIRWIDNTTRFGHKEEWNLPV